MSYKKWLKNVGKAVQQGVSNAVQQGVDKAKDYAEEKAPVVQQAIQNVANNVNNAISTGQQAVQNVSNAVQQGVDKAKDYAEEKAPVVQQVAKNVGNNVNNAISTGQQAASNTWNSILKGLGEAKDYAEEKAPVVQQVAKNVGNNVNNAISTGQQAVQNVANSVNSAISTGKELVNVGKAVYEGAMSGIKDYYAGDSNKEVPQETDWAAEYDKVMAESPSTNASVQSNTQDSIQASIVPSSSTTPSSSQQQNPDGSVTVTQPNGQPINTSPAASAALGEGAGQWQAELDSIMNQIMNREKFSYDMNGDVMYQQYADMFKNQANLGMQNAMGQAAALTGGYGSSYAQMVGQQAYAQQMQGLNDVALDLYDRAYNQYQDEGNQLAQQYAMIADREQQAYNRGYQAERDTVADSQWNQSFEYQKYLDELNQKNYENEFEYQKGRDSVVDERYNKEFEYQQGRDTVADSQWQQSMDYQKYLDELNQKNYEKEFEYQQDRDAINDERYNQEWAANEEQREIDNQYRNDVFEYEQDRDAINDERYNQEWAANEEQREIDNQYRNDALAEDQRQFNESMNWQAEEWDKMYGADGFYTKQNAQDQENWEKQWAASEEQRGIENKRYDDALADQKEANNPNTTYEGDGVLNGEKVPKQIAHVEGLTTTNLALFDEYGNFKTATISEVGKNKDGTNNGYITWNIGGKEVRLQAGVNPYTKNKNPDVANGTFDNGYQPDNYGGAKLEESGITDWVNGRETPVYQIKGSKPTLQVIWDDASNQYLSYGEQELPDRNEITIESKDTKPTQSPTNKPVTPTETPTESPIDIPPEWEEEINDKIEASELAGTIDNPNPLPEPTGNTTEQQAFDKMLSIGWKDATNTPYSQAERDRLVAQGKMIRITVNGEVKYLMR